MEEKYFDEIKEREQAATPGPWRIGNGEEECLWNGANAITAMKNGKAYVVMERAIYPKSHDFNEQVFSDIKFSAYARTDIPALISEVERLTALVKDAAVYCEECIHSENEYRGCPCALRFYDCKMRNKEIKYCSFGKRKEQEK